MIVGTGFPSICSDGSTIKTLATMKEMKRMDFKMIVSTDGIEIISRDSTSNIFGFFSIPCKSRSEMVQQHRSDAWNIYN